MTSIKIQGEILFDLLKKKNLSHEN